MSDAIVAVGVPTALGGHLAGMELTPRGLRDLGLLDRLPGTVIDAGDVAIEPGFRMDADPRAKNREAICAFLPRERDLVVAALSTAGPDARLLVLGGDCTAHAGALAVRSTGSTSRSTWTASTRQMVGRSRCPSPAD
jgi:arginase family enzyme